jgi:hypothetical protein
MVAGPAADTTIWPADQRAAFAFSSDEERRRRGIDPERS